MRISLNCRTFFLISIAIAVIAVFIFVLYVIDDPCTIRLERVELHVVNITARVYAPCNYTGKLLTEPSMNLGQLKCVATGA